GCGDGGPREGAGEVFTAGDAGLAGGGEGFRGGERRLLAYRSCVGGVRGGDAVGVRAAGLHGGVRERRAVVAHGERRPRALALAALDAVREAGRATRVRGGVPGD